MERYDALEIPYHYNEVLDFNGRQRSPDIGFAWPDRKIIYHEHAGLKTQEYRDGLMDKLQLVEALIRDRYFS